MNKIAKKFAQILADDKLAAAMPKNDGLGKAIFYKSLNGLANGDFVKLYSSPKTGWDEHVYDYVTWRGGSREAGESLRIPVVMHETVDNLNLQAGNFAEVMKPIQEWADAKVAALDTNSRDAFVSDIFETVASHGGEIAVSALFGPASIPGKYHLVKEGGNIAWKSTVGNAAAVTATGLGANVFIEGVKGTLNDESPNWSDVILKTVSGGLFNASTGGLKAAVKGKPNVNRGNAAPGKSNAAAAAAAATQTDVFSTPDSVLFAVKEDTAAVLEKISKIFYSAAIETARGNVKDE